MHESDSHLVAPLDDPGTQAADEFDEFARYVWPSLVRTARLMGASAQAAEDHAQAALVKAHLAWRKVMRSEDPVAYVHRMVVNVRIDEMRKRSATEVPSERLAHRSSGQDVASGVALRRDVATALDVLPLKQRQVLVLRYFVGMNETEAAAALKVPVGTVKSRTARALRALSADSRIVDLVSRSSR